MASYKDILGGTLNTITDKVKEVTESGGVREIYDRGANRAKAYAHIARLTLDLNRDSEELKKVYTEIGKLYFEQNRLAPDGLYTGLFAQAETLAAGLRARQEEINGLKAELEAEAGAREMAGDLDDFESIVSATEDEGKGKDL